MTGSKAVITLNLNRIVQDCDRAYGLKRNGGWKENTSFLKNYLIGILERVYKYHQAYNSLLHWAKHNHLYAAYDAGFIDLDKQYLTVGIAGLNQSAEFLGMQCNKNDEYKDYCQLIFGTIKEQNLAHRTKIERYNCEQIPKICGDVKLLLIDSELFNMKDNEGQARFICAA